MIARDPYKIETVPAEKRVRAEIGDMVIADSTAAKVMHETGLSPIYYFPRTDVDVSKLEKAELKTFCPFKGTATYYSVSTPKGSVGDAAWRYEKPLTEVNSINDYYAFDPAKVTIRSVENNEVIETAAFGQARTNLLSDWLSFQAFISPEPKIFLEQLGQKLIELGMAVCRISVSIRTLHPELVGRGYIWHRDEPEIKIAEFPRNLLNSPEYLNSPHRYVAEGLGGVRQRLDVESPEFQFPIISELKEAGCTDYVAMPLRFSDGTINVITFTSDHAKGFNTDQLGNVFLNIGVISKIFETHSQRETMASLLDAYLGPRTSKRVRDGASQRGDGETIEAAIMYCDLRDSTRLAETLDRGELLDLLNNFFERVVDPVHRNGGEVLKFIGDAVLAIFPAEGDMAAASCSAKKAADEILQLVRSMELPTGGQAECVIAIHAGPVKYGNVGTSSRLDYTATGPAVNRVVRMHERCKEIDRDLIFSDAVAENIKCNIIDLGTFLPRGTTGEMHIYGEAA